MLSADRLKQDCTNVVDMMAALESLGASSATEEGLLPSQPLRQNRGVRPPLRQPKTRAKKGV